MKALFLALILLVSALCVAPLAAAQEPVEPANEPVSEPIAISEPPVEAPINANVQEPTAAPVEVVSAPQAVIQPPTNATQAPSNATAPVAQGGLSPEIQNILRYTATALLCVVGLVFVFAGYRVFKIGLFALGFIAFFAIVWIILYQHASVWYNGSLWWLCYVIPALAGVAGGFMFLCILKVGVFFVGFILGVALAGIVLSTPLGTKVLTIYWTHVVIVAGAGVVLGVLALFLEKAILVIGTSAIGSYMIAVGIDMSFSQTRVLSAVLENIFSGQNINLNWDDIKSNVLPYALIAGMIVFCIAGIIVQFCYTGRNYDHRSGKNKKRDPYGYDESTAPLLPQ